MELGFTEPFLIEAMHRYGWLVDVSTLPSCGRATTYVARPYVGNAIEVGRQVGLGPHDTGWEGYEGSHRWTRGDAIATFPLPDQDGPSRVTIRASNPFPFEVRVKLYDGDELTRNVVVAASSNDVEIVIGPCYHPFIGMKSSGIRPVDVWPNSADTRKLGLMVHSIRIDLA